ncbi:hypothetical protein [Ancylobacter sp.]|uniref:hypothetical protein n=1 Tax=Ancylobacter sp. TaxID=1872567 RepID=UPI003D12263E
MKFRFYRAYVRVVDAHLPILRARLTRWLSLESRPSEVAGGLTHPGDVHAVFVIWQPRETGWYVWNALDALAEAGINVTLVVNNPLPVDRLEALRARAHRVLLRDNSGFDMGGYRDAILGLAGRAPDRLLILNDSVYYFRAGLTELFSRLAISDHDVCATYENCAVQHHTQSFCYSISRRMLEQPDYIRFWKDYLPVNVRGWAIRKGEIAGAHCLARLARSTEVLFSAARLRTSITALDLAQLQDLADYLPSDSRAALRALPQRREALVDEILAAVDMRSQIHSSGFLCRRFLGSPLLKRDLMFRGLYRMHELETLLRTVGAEGHDEEILADMRRKGVGSQLLGRARQRFLLDI